MVDPGHMSVPQLQRKLGRYVSDFYFRETQIPKVDAILNTRNMFVGSQEEG